MGNNFASNATNISQLPHLAVWLLLIHLVNIPSNACKEISNYKQVLTKTEVNCCDFHVWYLQILLHWQQTQPVLLSCFSELSLQCPVIYIWHHSWVWAPWRYWCRRVQSDISEPSVIRSLKVPCMLHITQTNSHINRCDMFNSRMLAIWSVTATGQCLWWWGKWRKQLMTRLILDVRLHEPHIMC